MSSADLTAVLAALEPVGRHRVMDLVEEAGASVAAWAVKRGGLPVANPSANPAYCYEWAFGKGAEPVVLCVWHDTLEVDGTRIVYRDNLRRLGLRLDDIANNRRETKKNRDSAKRKVPRAHAFDHRCQEGWNSGLPVRLILLKGERADDDAMGRDTSSVEFRRLDSEPWRLAHYDMMTGDFELVRGAAVDDVSAPQLVVDVDASPEFDPTEADPIKADPAKADSPEAQPYVDQFDVVEPPEKRDVQGSSYVRSAQVRAEVLVRAAGVCEACGEKGFRMANGAIYLETHHVIPLSQSGPDVAWNVVAVCANDHRIAHFGENRVGWQNQMIEHLSKCYPAADVTRRLLELER